MKIYSLNNFKLLDDIALKKAEQNYGFDISNCIYSVVNIKNIITEYSLENGLNQYVYAIIKHE